MKFGQTLKYNAVPDWLPHYMAYDQCKHMLDVIRVLRIRLFYVSDGETMLPEQPVLPRHGDDSSDDDTHDTATRHGHSSAVRSSRHSQNPILERSASQAVLQDLSNVQAVREVSAMMIPPSSPKHALNVEEGLSVRHLQAQLELADKAFFDKLHSEALKVDEFYTKMMAMLPQYSTAHEQKLAELLFQPDAGSNSPFGDDMNHLRLSVSFPDADDQTPLLQSASTTRPPSPSTRPPSPFTSMSVLPMESLGGSHGYRSGRRFRRNTKETELAALRLRICSHYLDIVGMIKFSELNWTAFDKILKKHDKITQKTTRANFMENLRQTRAFPDATAVETLRSETEALFARAFWNGNMQAAKEELLDGVRDQIIWSRNTVWRDMLCIERKVAAFRHKRGDVKANLSDTASEMFSVTAKPYPLLMALACFVFVLAFPGIVYSLNTSDGPQYSVETLNAAHRCLALLVAVVIMWGKDALPLYVTGFLVLPGTVLLRLLLDEQGRPLSARKTAEQIFHSLSSSTIMLIICVYTLHSGLSKYDIDKRLASEVLSRFSRPELLLLAVMVLAVGISMLVSNVASPVLLNSIVLPVLRDAPRSARPFVQCILLGVAVGSNIGGMPSPISSPQNAVALGLLKGKNSISFVQWLAVAVPLCAMMLALAYLVLLLWFKPHQYRLPKVPKHDESFALPHYVVLMTMLITVMLWSWHGASKAFGSAGMVAVLPVIIFYGTGILNKEDFNNLPWDVVYLVAGGIVLGKAVESSKLLDLLAGRLHVLLGGAPVWVAYAVFSMFMAFVANMISHTVSAIIVLPIIMEVGSSIGHERLMVMGGVLACSGAMSLPISSFPNMAALTVLSELGEPYLSSDELLRIGIPMTIMCAVVVLTLGYSWMKNFGF